MMESAIRLCYSAAPLRLSYGSKGSENERASTFQLRFNHANLCLPQFSISHPVAYSFRHANCMLNKFSAPSKNEGSDNKILRGVTGASLVLACVLGLFNFCGKMNPNFDTAYAMPSFMSLNHKPPTLEAGGEFALDSLLKVVNAEAAEDTITWFHQEPDKPSIDLLKLYAIRLSKSGNKDEALNILEKEYSKWENSSAGHDLGMALVELRIFQGNYEDARNRLDYQIDQRYLPEGHNTKLLKYEEKIKKLVDRYEAESFEFEKRSIAQILLYKAIVHTMLKQKEAAKWWEAFTKTL